MTDIRRRVAIDVELLNNPQVIAAFKAMGVEGETALKKIERANRAASPSFKAIKSATDEAKSSIEDLAASAGPAGRVLSSLGPTGLVVAAGVGAVALAFNATTRAAIEAESASVKLDSVLRGTGNTTGKTRKELDDLAESLQKITAIDDDQIKNVIGSLATFRSISGDIFDGVLLQAANLSATFGGDLASNTDKLADAMAKLAGGEATGLRKQFSFLSVEQLALVKRLAESGQAIDAQRALLKALQQQVGGSAEARTGTTVGSIEQLRNAWGDFLKAAGSTGPTKALIDGLTLIAERATQGAVAFNKLVNSSARSTQDNIARLKNEIDGAEQRAADRPGIADAWQKEAEKKRALLAMYQELAAAEQKAEKSQKAAAEARAARAAKEDEVARKQEKVTDKARVAAKQAEEERARAKKSLDEYISSLSNENNLLQLSERDRAGATAAIEAESRARAAGVKYIQEYVSKARDLALKSFDQKQVNKAIEDAAKKQEELLKDSQAKVAEYVKSSTDEVVNYSAGVFESLFDKGVSSFEDLSKSALQIMRRLFAQLASEAIIRPIFAPIMQGFMGAGGFSGGEAPGIAGGTDSSFSSLSSVGSFFSANSINSFGSTLGFGNTFTPGVGWSSGFTSASLSSVLGAAGIGAVGGSLLASLTGGNQVGSSIGGGAGATIGMIAGGPIGGVVGGLAGSLLGGLVGGGRKSSMGAGGWVDLDSGQTYDVNVRKASQASASALEANLNAAVKLIGALENATGQNVTGGFGVETAERRNGTKITFGNLSARYGNLDSNAALKFITSNVNQIFSDLDEGLKKIVERSGDLDTVINNINFYKTYKDLTDLKPALTAAEQQMKALADEALAFADKANNLGLNGKLALDAYAKKFDDQIKDQITAVVNPAMAALAEEQKAADARLETAKKLGANLAQVEQLNALRRAEILKQQNSDLVNWLQGQQLGSNSSLTDFGKLGAAQQQFNDLVSRARSTGDTSGVTQAADTLLSLKQGITGGATLDFSMFEQSIRQTVQGLVGQSATDSKPVVTAISQSTVETLNTMQAMIAELSALRAELQRDRQIAAQNARAG